MEEPADANPGGNPGELKKCHNTAVQWTLLPTIDDFYGRIVEPVDRIHAFAMGGQSDVYRNIGGDMNFPQVSSEATSQGSDLSNTTTPYSGFGTSYMVPTGSTLGYPRVSQHQQLADAYNFHPSEMQPLTSVKYESFTAPSCLSPISQISTEIYFDNPFEAPLAVSPNQNQNLFGFSAEDPQSQQQFSHEPQHNPSDCFVPNNGQGAVPQFTSPHLSNSFGGQQPFASAYNPDPVGVTQGVSFESQQYILDEPQPYSSGHHNQNGNLGTPEQQSNVHLNALSGAAQPFVPNDNLGLFDLNSHQAGSQVQLDPSIDISSGDNPEPTQQPDLQAFPPRGLEAIHRSDIWSGDPQSFDNDNVPITGGFNEPDYQQTSTSLLGIGQTLSLGPDPTYFNISLPKTLMDGSDIHGRSHSEPFHIGMSGLSNNGVAQVRLERMQQQMTAYEQMAEQSTAFQMMNNSPIQAQDQIVDGAAQNVTPKNLQGSGGGSVQVGVTRKSSLLPDSLSQAFVGTDRAWSTVTQPELHLSSSNNSDGAVSRKSTRRKMGQEASQLQGSDNLKHDIRLADRAGPTDASRSNGWTPVNNGSGDQQPGQALNGPETQTSGGKRKRSLQPGSSNGLTSGRSDVVADIGARENTTAEGATAQSSQHGLGISVPRKARTASGSSEDSLLASFKKPSPARRPAPSNGSNHEPCDPAAVSDGRSRQTQRRASNAESGSDVDKDAAGLFERIAAVESEDDDEVFPAAPGHSRPRAIRPTNNVAPHGWRAAQQPAGTHYTIYSPLVQRPAYTQSRPAPESFDPTAPLSAHEESQLRDEGRFTKMEQSFLKDAILEYCKKYNISEEEVNDYVCGKAREGNIPSNFWDDICKVLPQRTKNSIQRAAKRVFRNNQKKGSWTAEEEKALAEAYEKAPDQWAKICEEVPGRSAEQCRDRWRNYTSNGLSLTRGPWSEQEETAFLKICKDMLHQAREDRDKQRREGRTISETFDPVDHLNFTAISTAMEGKRSRLHCRNKWHKLKKRPDVEAVIAAVMKGGSTGPSTAPQSNKPPTPQVTVPTMSGSPVSASSTSAPQPLAQQAIPRGDEQHQLPSVSQALRDLLPISAHSGGGRVAAGPSCAHLFPNDAHTNTTPSLHTLQRAPAMVRDPAQGRDSAQTASQDPRTGASSAPPQQASMNRPSLPPPIPSAPTLARTPSGPAILPPISESFIPTPTSAASAVSSAPPSWLNAPPVVPQLFTSSTGLPTNLSASHQRATPGLKRAMPPTTAGAVSSASPFYNNNNNNNNNNSSSNNVAQTLGAAVTGPPDRSLYSTTPPHHARGPVLAPITSTSPSHAETLQSVPSVVPMANGAPITPSSGLASRINGYGSSRHTTASPDSATSAAIADDISDGRPVRKKQKTAKARGEE